MNRLFAILVAVCLAAFAASCGGDGPTTPTETRIISLSGDMTYGDVEVGQSANRTLRISNVGNAVLTINSITMSTEIVDGFATSLASSTTIQPSASIDVLLIFRPLQARQYLGLGNVQGNMTSGTNSFSVSGTGVVK